MSRTSAGIQYNARSMNGIISINADEITATNITTDIIKASNLLEADTPETITAQWTYNVLPQSTVVPTLGPQLVNKTYVDTLGAGYVTLSTAQTISGLKTFSGNVRINNTKNLIFGTTTGGIIQYAPVGMIYNNEAGSSHFFFISGSPSVDIDSGGLVIRTGKKVQFYAGSTIDENSGGNSFDTNIPTGYTYKFKINSVDKLSLHPTFGATFADNVNIQSNKYLNFSGGSYLLEEPSFTNLIYNVPTSYKHQFRVNGFDAVAISRDANGTLLSFPSGSIMREYTSFNWFLYQLPAGHTLKYQVGGNEIFEIQSGGAILYEGLSIRDGKKILWDQGFTNIAYLRKDTTTSTFDYEVATGYKHKFMVNGTSVLNIGGSAFGLRSDNNVFILNNNWLYLDSFNDGIRIDPSGNMILQSLMGTGNFQFFTGASIIGTMTLSSMSYTNNNYAINLGSTNICSIKQDTATTAFFHTAPTGYIHRFRIGTTTRMDIIDTGLKVYQGYFIKQGSGTTTFGSSVFNNFWTGSVYQAWIDGTNVGSYTLSDYRIKESVVKARPVLERLLKIDMIEYEFKDISIFKKHGTHHGFYAHQVQELFPELDNIVSGEKDATNEAGEIQPQTICAEFGNLYLSAIQELNAKIEAQQKIMEDQQRQIDQLLVLFSSRMV